MKINDQILDITQVNTLTDLGFDVEKHSSMVFNFVGKDVSIEPLAKELSNFTCHDYLATMTTGDIIYLLPSKITTDSYEDYFLEIEKLNVRYVKRLYGYTGNTREFKGEKLIDSLFEALTWCIENKYIK